MAGKGGAGGEKWITDYSSRHYILLVGEGDFSFSLCLADAFGSASNIVASSLDTYEVVTKKYKDAESNLERLKKLGASLFHGVDATNMKLHPSLKKLKFDRIIFNFPHAGFKGKEDDPRLIERHRMLVLGFFRNAESMLYAYGQVHVRHKTTSPFRLWNIKELGESSYLSLIECIDFKIEDYPGYNNKRGDGGRSDEPFPLGKCRTFKFRFPPSLKSAMSSLSASSRRSLQVLSNPIPMLAQPIYPGHEYPVSRYNRLKSSTEEWQSDFLRARGRAEALITPQQLHQNPFPMQCQPTSFNQGHFQNAVEFPGHSQASLRSNFVSANVGNEYFNPALGTHDRTVNHFDASVSEAWMRNSEWPREGFPRRTSEGDLYVSRELEHLLADNVRRRDMLVRYGQHSARPMGDWFRR